jgi:hypothetical protein
MNTPTTRFAKIGGAGKFSGLKDAVERGVVSMLDKFPGICYNRLWTYCLLGGGDMGKMVIEVPEELTELGKAMAQKLA